MIDSLFEENQPPPPLPTILRNPTPQPPLFPELPSQLVQEIVAMDVELPELNAIADAELLDPESTRLMTQDSGIIHASLQLPPSSQLSVQSLPVQLEPPSLTLALLGAHTPQPTGKFFFNPNSETETLDAVEDFHDAQGSYLSPTYSELDRSFTLNQPSSDITLNTNTPQSGTLVAEVQPSLALPGPNSQHHLIPSTPVSHGNSDMDQLHSRPQESSNPTSATPPLRREMTRAEQIEARDNEHVRRVLELKTQERIRPPPQQRENSVQGAFAEARQKSASPPSSLTHPTHNIWGIRLTQGRHTTSGGDAASNNPSPNQQKPS